MHPLKPLLLVGIGAAAIIVENDSACNPVSTIFITLPASPNTGTHYALSDGSAATVGIEALANGVAQVTSTATKTVTATMVSTQVVSVIQASSPSGGQALYSFAEENGTTTWLGATPPASASLITSTQVVTMQPVPPGYVAPPVEATPVTSYLTLSSTETLTETLTKTQTLTVPIASASAGAYTGLASNGWNSSMPTFITVKTPAIGSVTIEEKLAQYSGTAYPVVSSGVVPVPRGNTMRLNKARDIADIIVATIDGVVVSWTDSYDGTPLSTSGTSPVVAPVTTTALLLKPDTSPVSSPFSSPVQTESSSSTAPTTTVSVSVLDVLSTSSPTSTSSSSADQLTTSDTSSSPLRSNTAAVLSTAAAATASSCGDAPANFIINFDDLPAFSAGPEDTDIPPIFNPYHHLFFQQYFGYVPPPSDPFPPISPPQLAIYRANGSGTAGSPGLELAGEIGSGPRASESAFWIDAYSAYLGCNNAGPDDCSITVKGHQDSSFFSTITQGFTLPPCPGLKNCSLALLEFADGFRSLTGLQIIATVGDTPVDWYMDNLSLGWSNNTCAAQLERSSQD